MFRIAIHFALLSTLLCCSIGSAADWYQFRGPNASGQSNESHLPTAWSTDSNIKWKVPVPGEGWSSPLIVGGKVFVTTAVSDDQKNRNTHHRWEIHCFDETTGATQWKKIAIEGKPRVGTHPANTYASETPITDGQRIIAYFGMTGLFCYDLNGELLWQKDLGAYNMQMDWGTSSSPALHDGLVFIQVDNQQDSFLVALDIKTGEERWRKSREENSNWGSPIIWKNRLRTELVTSGKSVRSYNPTNGDLIWEMKLGNGNVNSTPSGSESVLLVGSAGMGGRSMVAVNEGAEGNITLAVGQTSNAGIRWSNTGTGPQMSSPLCYEGYIYLLGQRGGQLTCLNATTGEQIYQERLQGAGEFWASPFAYNGKIFCPDANGSTYVLKPGPEFNLLGTNQLEGKFWASSAIANGSIILRSTDTLYSISEKLPSPNSQNAIPQAAAINTNSTRK